MNSLSTMQEVGLLIGIPLAFLAFVTLLVFASEWAHEARYRPGTAWTADPTWLTAERPGERGSSRYGDGGDTVVEPPPEAVRRPGDRAEPPEDLGGSSATW